MKQTEIIYMDNIRKKLKPVSIYQIFPRDYSDEGTLKAVTADLERIQNMGFDYIYLLPIHPIGLVGRKGSMGSPYSIQDYYAVNPDYGTMKDFDDLISKAHSLGLKIMMDIVFNHSANDNLWTFVHPDWYFRDADGHVARKVSDWTDISDYDFSNRALWEQLFDVLKFWQSKGVDAYRCDVAPMVPIEFWCEARKQIAEADKNFIWLAESTESEYILPRRRMGIKVSNDPEEMTAFDICYPYDIYNDFYDAAVNKNLLPYEKMLNFTEAEYPLYYNRLMCLENHDKPRIQKLVQHDLIRNYNWMAFSFIYPGTAFVYAGQEAQADHQPSLFEYEPVNWFILDKVYTGIIKKMNDLRKTILSTISFHEMIFNHECLEIYLQDDNSKSYYGIFNVNHKESIPVHLKDGEYTDLIFNETVTVKGGSLNEKRPRLLDITVDDVTAKAF